MQYTSITERIGVKPRDNSHVPVDINRDTFAKLNTLAKFGPPSQGTGVLRVHQSLTAVPERAILNWLCRHMPQWVTSDGLTALGVLGAGLTGLGFALGGNSPAFVVLAIVGVVLNWLGDSLDGSLARHRKCERTQYGFFLDLAADSLAIALITMGIGFSPFAHMVPALTVLAAYYLLMILSMIVCLATGVFKISFGRIGSTEIRLFIIACATAILLFPVPHWFVAGNSLTLYDAILTGVTAFMVIQALLEMRRTGIALSRIDPPRG